MHVHSAAHGASFVRSHEADSSARSAASAASPFSTVTDTDASTTSDTATSPDASASGAAATGGSAANPFSSLSSNLQALLLGIGQNGLSGGSQQGPATIAGALQAYGQNSLFG